MTDKARETIADVIWDVTDEGTFDHSVSSGAQVDAMADAILTALPSIIADIVEPLEWHPVSDEGPDVTAAGIGGDYTISYDSSFAGGTAYVWTPGQNDSDDPAYDDDNGTDTCPVVWANAHHRATIRKALGMKEGSEWR